MTQKYIGIDVGGTKILLQVFDAKLKLTAEKKVKTDVSHGKAGFLKQLYGLIDEFFDSKTLGISVAVPGIVDYKRGVLVKAPHLPTGRDLKLKALLEKQYKVPVHIDHDINAFLAEEYKTPALAKYQNVLAVMVGTGLGGAAIVNGKLYYGESGFAGEFGHMVIDEHSRLKTLEQNTSGHFIPQITRMVGEKNLKKHLIENLGLGLANLNLIFNPEVMVLGGSVYLNLLRDRKIQLGKIIARHSLDGKAPKLIDANPKASVARGAVRLLADR